MAICKVCAKEYHYCTNCGVEWWYAHYCCEAHFRITVHGKWDEIMQYVPEDGSDDELLAACTGAIVAVLNDFGYQNLPDWAKDGLKENGKKDSSAM